MIQNTVIDRCLKLDFKALERNEEGDILAIRWGKKNEVDRVYSVNIETNEPFFTGEIKETDWCTYESGAYSGEFSRQALDKVFATFQRQPKMRELQVFGEALGMTEQEIVSWMKPYLLNAIAKHDKSKDVEDFTINGVHLWLDGDLRNKVRENLEYCQTMGIENTTLRYEGMEFPMTIEMGWQLYYAVLGYARDTWNVTEVHNAAVPKIETVQEMIDYEDSYPSAYPSKLVF